MVAGITCLASIVLSMVAVAKAVNPVPLHNTQGVVRPRTNAEAFRQGLPPLAVARRGTRAWTAAKRAASPVFTTTVVNFDSGESSFAPVSNPSQGYDFNGLSYYVSTDNFDKYINSSPPNCLFYQGPGNLATYIPVITNANGALFRLNGLTCSYNNAEPFQDTVTVIGSLNGATLFSEHVDCSGTVALQNTFSNLPFVDTVTFSANNNGNQYSGCFDDISLSSVM